MTDLRPCLFIFREDLRLSDNPALAAAVATGRPMICLFVQDAAERAGGARQWWLHHALTSLSADIDAAGGRLVVVAGPQNKHVIDIVTQSNVAEVFWTRRYGPDHIKMDSDLKADLQQKGVKVTSLNGRLLLEPWALKTGAGGHYRVFTPFWKAMKRADAIRAIVPRVDGINGYDGGLSGVDIASLQLLPDRPNWAREFPDYWQPGERGAEARLTDFIATAAKGYRDDRNRPDRTGTSGLSPHLQHGEISPIQIWHAVHLAVDQGVVPDDQADVFLSEIAWREFSYTLLFHHPNLENQEINQKFADFPWGPDDVSLAAWQMGQTGYPIVDAGMRQLWQTGWMHNRVRMIVGSFLVKHLMVDWRAGKEWFWDTLVDADLAANSASWQWIAGCGADAAPYFRVFNPILQGERFDPNGDYIRRYVPELSNVPDKYLCAPWTAPAGVLNDAGVTLGVDYPKPIVDHKLGRERALAAYKSISG